MLESCLSSLIPTFAQNIMIHNKTNQTKARNDKGRRSPFHDCGGLRTKNRPIDCELIQSKSAARLMRLPKLFYSFIKNGEYFKRS